MPHGVPRSSGMKPLFKVCAVAKDEGPYLAEWVFHHLHFGFDLIHVYINRTSDASAAVLERIGQSYPQVTFEFIDWIDLCDPGVSAKLQTVAYAKELEQSRQQGVNWLLFLDIDEFWTPNDFATSVDRFVARTCVDGRPQPICHLWHCELGQHAPFTPLQRGAGYELSSHLKTLFPLDGIDIRHVRVHHPIFGAEVTPLDADGAPMTFDEQQSELASRSAMKPKSAYIIHRMYRSEQEYMALSLRGRPSQRRRLKMNRPGYRSHRNVSIRYRFFWPEEEYRDYALQRERFLAALDIESLITQDKADILARARRAVRMVKERLETPERTQAIAFLRGTRHAVVEAETAPAPSVKSPVEPMLDTPVPAQATAPSSGTNHDVGGAEKPPVPSVKSPVAAEPIQAPVDQRVGEPETNLPSTQPARPHSWFMVMLGWLGFSPGDASQRATGSASEYDRR
ncbi:glycosyltransferase family 2 protein [Salinicola salarius]|uniref:glycosyltransferase family 2 protein n=1 Tax=Salinicola salarius TaxID=430457 RepID=UPI000DA1B1D0|nr:glycosyltransferase family 2 protein [Salinicola salarius]